jgi:outer membrane protein
MAGRGKAWTVVGGVLLGLSAGVAVAADAGRPFESRVVVVNIDRVLATSAPALEASRRVADEFRAREQALEQQGLQLRQMSLKLEQDSAHLSERERVVRSREIEDLARNLDRKRAQFREDLAERQAGVRAAVAARVYEIIKTLPRDQQVDLVLINAFWSSPRVDFTDQVVRMLEH